MRPRPWILCAAGFGIACANTPLFRSGAEVRAEDLLSLAETDVAKYELAKPSVQGDPEVTERFVGMAFDRTVSLAIEQWTETFPEDPARKEQIRQRFARLETELVEWGPAAANHCVGVAGEVGLRYEIACEILGRTNGAWVDVAIVEATVSPDASRRRGAIRAAVAANAARRLEKDLYPLLSDPAWIVRREAAVAVAVSGGSTPEVGAALIKLLDDPQLLVATEAAGALGKRRVRDAVDPLLRFLERAKNANDPIAIDSALKAFQALSGRTDFGSDLASWRLWVSQNRPIVDTRPAGSLPKNTPAPESQPSENPKQTR